MRFIIAVLWFLCFFFTLDHGKKLICYFLYCFSHVFQQCVQSKVFSQLGFKTWRCRKNSGRGLILCICHGFAFSRWLETYMTSSNAAALPTQNNRCTTWKHCESYREQMFRMLSNRSRTLKSYADCQRGAAPSQTHPYNSPSVGIKKRELLPTTS